MPPRLPLTYVAWQHRARALLAPLADLMSPGRADIPLRGLASNHGPAADRLESFVRPLILAAFFLQTAPDPTEPADAPLRKRLADWFRSALALGSDSASPEYWGTDANYHQHHVEMGLLVIALQLAPAALWDPLTTVEKTRVAHWLGSARGGGIVINNHLFMSAHILEFLRTKGFSRPTDQAVIDAQLGQLETMHRGGGWFEDGINQAFDHYTAYAFHFYGLMWVRLHGHRNPARADRWRGWTEAFVLDYQHFFAASGEHPAFGRSITYRFGVVGVFGLALAETRTAIPPGRLRRLCTRNLDFFLSRPVTTDQDTLNTGFTDAFDGIAENYSCAASTYWCAKGFTPLLLPPDHPYWHDVESPLPAETGFVRPIPSAGLLVRSLPAGEVELLNGGSMISRVNTHFGPWKWSKFAYRTGTGFSYAPTPASWSADSALLQILPDGTMQGRHSTTVLEMDATRLGCIYNLGHRDEQISTPTETWCFWRDGWLLTLHRLEPFQSASYQHGGYALPLALPGSAATAAPDADTLRASAPDGRVTVLQSLSPGLVGGWEERRTADQPRLHTHAPWHATPVFCTPVPLQAGPAALAFLAWTGAESSASAPWRPVALDPGRWRLSHPALGEWEMHHPSLVSLA